MRVDDAVGKGVVDRLLEDGAEAGHRDEIDVVAVEGVDHLVGVRDAVEVGPEARALDHLDRHAGRARRSSIAPHGRSTSTTDDGEVGVQHAACRIVPLPDASTPIRLTLET